MGRESTHFLHRFLSLLPCQRPPNAHHYDDDNSHHLTYTAEQLLCTLRSSIYAALSTL